MMDHDVFDVVVIGAGCSGLCCARALVERGARVLVLDAGRPLADRQRMDPVDAACGVGGAGLYSDGKFSFWPSAQQLYLHVLAPVAAQASSSCAQASASSPPFEQNDTNIRQAFDECLALLRDAGGWDARAHGVAFPTLDGSESLTLPLAAHQQQQQQQQQPHHHHHHNNNKQWLLRSYPSFYLNLDQRKAIVSTLAAPLRGCMRLGVVIRDISLSHADAPLYTVVVQDVCSSSSSVESIRCRQLVVAAGRFAMHLPGLEPLLTRFLRFEFGLRIQTRADNPFFSAFAETDIKLLCRPTDAVSFRTFCVCRRGELVTTRAPFASSFVTVSGRADCAPTQFSNFGLMCRIHDAELGMRVEAEIANALRSRNRNSDGMDPPPNGCGGDSDGCCGDAANCCCYLHAPFSIDLEEALNDNSLLDSALGGATAGGLMRQGFGELLQQFPCLVEHNSSNATVRTPSTATSSSSTTTTSTTSSSSSTSSSSPTTTSSSTATPSTITTSTTTTGKCCTAARVYGPAVEGTGRYCDLLPDLSVRAQHGLFVTGDASGIFRGIVASMVSGVFVGRTMRFN